MTLPPTTHNYPRRKTRGINSALVFPGAEIGQHDVMLDEVLVDVHSS